MKRISLTFTSRSSPQSLNLGRGREYTYVCVCVCVCVKLTCYQDTWQESRSVWHQADPSLPGHSSPAGRRQQLPLVQRLWWQARPVPLVQRLWWQARGCTWSFPCRKTRVMMYCRMWSRNSEQHSNWMLSFKMGIIS